MLQIHKIRSMAWTDFWFNDIGLNRKQISSIFFIFITIFVFGIGGFLNDL
jgi:hypothetical protein